MRWATSIFHSTSRAWPRSSMSRQITAAPYSRASVITRSKRLPGSSPSSRLAELRIARPPMCCSPASITWRLGGVEHQRHAGLGGEALGDLVHVDGAVAADVVDAHVEHVGAFADLLVRHLRALSQSPASIASRNALEPLALVRSPMIRKLRSCSIGTGL